MFFTPVSMFDFFIFIFHLQIMKRSQTYQHILKFLSGDLFTNTPQMGPQPCLVGVPCPISDSLSS